MILISFVLCVIAIIVLGVGAVAGWILGLLPAEAALLLTYLAIGITAVAAVLLAVGTVRARDEIFGGGSATASRRDGRQVPGSAAARAKSAGVKAKAPPNRSGAPRPTRTTGGTRPGRGSGGAQRGKVSPAPPSASGPEIPADARVVVVPGRRRYHLDNCRQLVGRTREDLSYEEARGEGFTPCTACMPDVALAARAGAGEPEDRPQPSEDGPPGTKDDADKDEATQARTDVATEDDTSSFAEAEAEASAEPGRTAEQPASVDEYDEGATDAATEQFAAVTDAAAEGDAATAEAEATEKISRAKAKESITTD